MWVRLLHDVGSDLAGAVIDMDDRRAGRLIATGYAAPAPIVEKVHAVSTAAVVDALHRSPKIKRETRNA